MQIISEIMNEDNGFDPESNRNPARNIMTDLTPLRNKQNETTN